MDRPAPFGPGQTFNMFIVSQLPRNRNQTAQKTTGYGKTARKTARKTGQGRGPGGFKAAAEAEESEKRQSERSAKAIWENDPTGITKQRQSVCKNGIKVGIKVSANRRQNTGFIV